MIDKVGSGGWYLPGVGKHYFLAGARRRRALTLLHRHQVADVRQHRLQVGHLNAVAGCARGAFVYIDISRTRTEGVILGPLGCLYTTGTHTRTRIALAVVVRRTAYSLPAARCATHAPCLRRRRARRPPHRGWGHGVRRRAPLQQARTRLDGRRGRVSAWRALGALLLAATGHGTALTHARWLAGWPRTGRSRAAGLPGVATEGGGVASNTATRTTCLRRAPRGWCPGSRPVDSSWAGRRRRCTVRRPHLRRAQRTLARPATAAVVCARIARSASRVRPA